MAERRALTFAEIVRIARQAGFPANVANTMAAIALAESGGRYWAVGDNFAVEGATRNPKARYDRGLFQINSMHGYDPNRLVSDPLYNAKAAFAIYQRQGLNAWTTYKVGAHVPHLNGNSSAQAAPQGGTQAAQTGGAAVAEPDKPKSQADLLNYIRENYPDVYGLMQVDAEIKNLLLKAAENEWGRAELSGALAKTKYYKNTISSARVWDAAAAQDEATALEKLARSRQEIATLARQLGVTVGNDFIERMAVNVNRLGWSEQMVRQALAARFRQATATAGAGTAAVDTLKAIAAQYAVPISDITLTNWTRDILAGFRDEQAFRSYVATQAKKMFPDIADEIDEGRTVRDYMDPYAEIAARLGVLGNPAEFDLSDRKWRRLVTTVDPETGKRGVRSIDDAETEMRTNTLYGYSRTRQGRAEGAQLATFLNRSTGVQI